MKGSILEKGKKPEQGTEQWLFRLYASVQQRLER